MRILVNIGHPAHVHFFKHIIWHLEKKGHEVKITSRDKDVALALLTHYGFKYETLSAIGVGFKGMAMEYLKREWALFRLIRRWKPDVVTEIGGLFIAAICRLMNVSSIVFTDTETVLLDRFLTHPFVKAIWTPDCFKKDLGRCHMRYRGYQELSYLHPNIFSPEPAVFDRLGVAEDEPYIILRFVSWQASHDVGQHGLSIENRRQAIRQLSHFGKVFVSSESTLPSEFEPYRLDLPPQHMHDVLYYARLYMGEGATMATEAGILGTPAVFISSLAPRLGNFNQLKDRYQLVYAYDNPDVALQKCVELLAQVDIKKAWEKRRNRMLVEKIDVFEMVIDLIEHEAR